MFQLSVRVTEELLKAIDEYCQENEMSRAQVIRLALRKLLDK